MFLAVKLYQFPIAISKKTHASSLPWSICTPLSGTRPGTFLPLRFPRSLLSSSANIIAKEGQSIPELVQIIPPERTRNFSIIAHIDHGKSTLADRLLEVTGTISRSSSNKQVLDKLKVERDRGITVRAQCASMVYTNPSDGLVYLLNLIDTPGHLDFHHEVYRSLSACQGVLLLVDAINGVQAQTVANFYLAYSADLKILPVINKIDLPTAEVDKVEEQILSAFELTDPVKISAKSGLNVEALIPRLISEIPPPSGSPESPFRAFLFDAWYDKYMGVICLLSIRDGTIKKGDSLISLHSKNVYIVMELGIMYPEKTPTSTLSSGQVGYVCLGIKNLSDAHLGDTFCRPNALVEPFPGLDAAKSMVHAGVYPIDASEYSKLKEALEKLLLEDSSIAMSKETSTALGQGFRLGFLGTLHMDVVKTRLEEEYDSQVVITSPTVVYRCTKITGSADDQKSFHLTNPSEFPSENELKNYVMEEPMVKGSLVFPAEYLGTILQLCEEHRGEQLELTYLDQGRVFLRYRFPMAEILTTFFDNLKSRSSGYATFDYSEDGYAPAELVKIQILINTKPVDALCCIAHESNGLSIARGWVHELTRLLKKQLFEVVIQGAINGKVVARSTLSALRKDVTAKLYGGDHTRRLKLLEKQKAGKKRMKRIGGIDVPPEAFLSLMNRVS